jgi:hypothetical protein
VCLETRPKCLELLLLSKRPKIAQGYLEVEEVEALIGIEAG